MTIVLATLLLAGSLGLLLVRSAPPSARALALAALVGLSVAALDPLRAELRDVPARVAVVPTATPDGGALALAERARAAGAETTTREGGRLAERLLSAAAWAGPRADETVVVFTGPAAAARPAPRGLAAAAVSATEVLPFDPGDLRVLCSGPLQVGRPSLLEVSLALRAPPMRADVALLGDDGRELLRRQLDLVPGGSVPLRLRPEASGRVRIRVHMAAAGAAAERSGELEVQPPRPVLVCGPDASLAAALRAQGAPVVVARELPADLAPFAAVVLAAPLPDPDAERLAATVLDGLGLLVTGPALATAPLGELLPVRLLHDVGRPGAGAGAPGGPTPREPRPEPRPEPPDRTPPAQPEPPQPDRPATGATEGNKTEPGPPEMIERRNVALVLVVDRSGSMGELVAGRVKMSYAKTSAMRSAQALAEGDAVGIVTFGNPGAGRVELPLTPVTEVARVRQGVDRLAHANEYTYLRPGLEAARDLLRDSRFAVRHVVVISDGDIHDDEIPLLALGRECRGLGITISVLQIFDQTGTSPSQKVMTEKLAATTGGLRYECGSADQVPVLVSAEVVRTLGRVGRTPRGEGTGPGPIPEPDPKPEPRPEPPEPAPPTPPEPPVPEPERLLPVRAVSDSELLLPGPAEGWPGLGDAIPCTGRDEAHVLLVVGDEGRPLLAFANRGLGRVGALAADLESGGNAAFRREPGFPARLAQWLETVRRPLPASEPRDALAPGAVLAEPRPTPADAAELASLTGSPLRALDSWQVPPPRAELLRRGMAADWALPAALVLLLLAFVEWLLARTRPIG